MAGECAACGGKCCRWAKGFWNPSMLTKKEIEAIRKLTGRDDFYTRDQGHFVMKNKGRGNINCIFLDESSRMCPIYESRPLECELFPLDIKMDGGKLVWSLCLKCPAAEKAVKDAGIREDFERMAKELDAVVAKKYPKESIMEFATFFDHESEEIKYLKICESKIRL